MKDLEVVGKSIIRVDGLSKVTGRAIYPGDITMEGMLYGKTLRSIKTHAYIKVDTSKAEKIEGVIKVFTAKDVPHNSHGVLYKDQEVFCSKKVRRIGDPIAFIVAENKKIAEMAVDKIEVEYEELEGVFDPIDAMKDDAPRVHDGGNIVHHCKIRKGNVDEAFKNCDAIVEAVYKSSMVDHAFLQPEAGIAYLDEDGKVVVCAATQYPHFDQEEIAEALMVPKEDVKVINPAVGGAFGGREDITLQIHIALAAKTLRKPIRAVYSREESFISHGKRHPMIMKYKTGVDQEGMLLAMEAEIIADTGAYGSWVNNVVRKAVTHATGPYEIPNVKIDGYGVYTNNPFAGAMRGFGAAQTPIAHEQQMDRLAEKLNIDPVTIRIKNGFRVGSKTATGQVLNESIPLIDCIEAVAKSLNLLTREGE
jgi:CO/xanthine dehydrogenase Mo-binding subunit